MRFGQLDNTEVREKMDIISHQISYVEMLVRHLTDDLKYLAKQMITLEGELKSLEVDLGKET